MDASIALIIAAAVFFVFLIAKMRPSFDDDGEPVDEPSARRSRRAEDRLLRRIRSLPRSGQQRIREALDKDTSRGHAEHTDAD
jgi:hypothetical protein